MELYYIVPNIMQLPMPMVLSLYNLTVANTPAVAMMRLIFLLLAFLGIKAICGCGWNIEPMAIM